MITGDRWPGGPVISSHLAGIVATEDVLLVISQGTVLPVIAPVPGHKVASLEQSRLIYCIKDGYKLTLSDF